MFAVKILGGLVGPFTSAYVAVEAMRAVGPVEKIGPDSYKVEIDGEPHLFEVVTYYLVEKPDKFLEKYSKKKSD